MSVSILIGDCRERMKELPDASVDSCVCDPPYHLTNVAYDFRKTGSGNSRQPKQIRSRGFMNQEWDGGDVAFQPETWEAALRVLKPGAHLIAFSGTRTYHRMVCAIEDAGFEIRDQLAWVYGSGFPKSKNLGGGWGTALKPAWEPICLARKPLDGTVAANVLKHGTGAINIDGCRIEASGRPAREVAAFREGVNYGGNALEGRVDGSLQSSKAVGTTDLGRWPANIIHDGSDEVLAGFPETEGAGNIGGTRRGELGYHGGASGSEMPAAYDAGGSAARFFQQCEWGEEDGYGLPEVQQNNAPADVSCGRGNLRGEDARRFKYCPKATTEERGEGNNHPTVKPQALMRWLVRLVTPPGGTVLDPFMGSGSTGIAADAEQFNFIGCEMSPEYAAIAERRIRDAAGMFAEVKAA